VARDIALKGIRGEFLAMLKDRPSLAGRIAQVVTATGASEDFFFAGQVPPMRQWLGSRLAKDMFQAKVNKELTLYEATLKTDRFEQKDSQLPAYFPGRIADLARSANRKVDERVLGDLIDASESTTGGEGTGYDGFAFHDSTHVDPAAEYTTAQDNDLTTAAATGTTPTLAEFTSAVQTAIETFRGFLDDRGQPWHAELPRVVLVIPPAFERVATEFLKSASVDATNPAIANALVGLTTFELIVNVWSANADRFTLEVPDAGRMPYGLVRDEVPVLQQVTGDRGGEVDFEVFNARYNYYGVYQRLAVLYGHWRNSIKHTFS